MLTGAITSVKVLTAFGATPLLAVTVIGNEPAVVGVPDNFPAALNVNPLTGVGLNANDGAGEPVIPVNEKLYAEPTVPELGVPAKFGATSVFAGAITNVNVFTAFGTTPLLAVTVIGNEPAVVGVPDSFPAALNVNPLTGVGLNANVGAGEPVIPVNEKLYGEPTVPELGVPVKLGATSVFAGAITRVNAFTAFGAVPLLAVTVIGNEPAVVGVPDNTPAALIVIPPATVAGLIANDGAGEPVIPVNEKLYGEPTVPELGVPVKLGATVAAATTSVNAFTAFGAVPLLAVTVIGNEPAVVGVPDNTPAALIVIPPATVAGLIANDGAGEPVIPVNEKLYGEPTVPELGVPVKLGATPTAASGNLSPRNT